MGAEITHWNGTPIAHLPPVTDHDAVGMAPEGELVRADRLSIVQTLRTAKDTEPGRDHPEGFTRLTTNGDSRLLSPMTVPQNPGPDQGHSADRQSYLALITANVR